MGNLRTRKINILVVVERVKRASKSFFASSIERLPISSSSPLLPPSLPSHIKAASLTLQRELAEPTERHDVSLEVGAGLADPDAGPGVGGGGAGGAGAGAQEGQGQGQGEGEEQHREEWTPQGHKQGGEK